MSTTTKPEPGTAVARQDPRRTLDAAGQTRLTEIRAQNALVMAITSESWGEKMSITQRRAFAEYMRRFRLDISEVDNLGGKPYRNGYYYRRRIAEMRSKGLVEWSAGEHIGPNPELDRLAAMTAADKEYDAELTDWAKGERRRRAQERIRWDIPADASHVYVVRVKLKGDQNPLEGCDYIAPGRMKKTKWGESVADPVGEAEPEKTVITRAWRRAGLLIAAEIPELRADEAAMDLGADEVTDAVEQAAIADEAREDRAKALPPGRSAMPAVLAPLADPADPYSPIDDARVPVRSADEPRTAVESRVAPPRSPASRAVAEHVVSTSKDPYTEPGPDYVDEFDDDEPAGQGEG